MAPSILCRFGFHRWEKVPSKQEFLRETGYLGVAYKAMQLGTKSCCNKHCSAKLRVYRVGLVTLNGGTVSSWKIATRKIVEHINSFPVF